MFIPILLPLVLSQNRIESQRFEWGDPENLCTLDVTVTQSDGVGRVVLNYSQGGTSAWDRNFSVSQVQGEPVVISAYPAAAGEHDRIFVIDLARNDWQTTMCLFISTNVSYDFSHTYRGTRGEFINLDRARDGRVSGVTTYDPWVGGVPKRHFIDGKLLDRWERVDERTVNRQGFKLISRRHRLVPAQGGGRNEELFAWRSDWVKRD